MKVIIEGNAYKLVVKVINDFGEVVAERVFHGPFPVKDISEYTDDAKIAQR